MARPPVAVCVSVPTYYSDTPASPAEIRPTNTTVIYEVDAVSSQALVEHKSTRAPTVAKRLSSNKVACTPHS